MVNPLLTVLTPVNDKFLKSRNHLYISFIFSIPFNIVSYIGKTSVKPFLKDLLIVGFVFFFFLREEGGKNRGLGGESNGRDVLFHLFIYLLVDSL